MMHLRNGGPTAPRKSYARIPDVYELPRLIEVQLDSFRWFQTEGLQELFDEVSPIVSFNKNLELHFGSIPGPEGFWFGEPKYPEPECRDRDMTFAAPLWVRVRLVNREERRGDMRRTETVVIGGGQAGLAMSRCLTDAGIDHVVLERGRVAERWRRGSWDSLRLLTPNWQSRLPGFRYDGADPDGYMAVGEVIERLALYARSFRAPVEEGTTVLAVERGGVGYRVTTDRGTWEAPSVVIATGHCDTPFVPPLARSLPEDVVQVVPGRYRNPRQLPEGGVLVVGASSTGVQLADEIHASGRPVTLAVGRHTRPQEDHRDMDDQQRRPTLLKPFVQ